MSSKTQSIDSLLADIEKRTKNRQSLTHLAKCSPFIKGFRNLEHFILSAFKSDQKQAEGVSYHLQRLIDGLARILWRNEVFLGIQTIGELFYSALLIEPEHPVKIFLEAVFESEIHMPGFVVYPLHSFGLINIDVISSFEAAKNLLNLSAEGIIVTPQNNDSQKTNAFLEHTCAAFGIEYTVPKELVEHFRKTRSLHWLDHNPLLAVKVASFSGLYHENQFIFILKLRLATALLMMMAAMGKEVNEEEVSSFSRSSLANNSQTLDLHDYLVFQAPTAKNQALEVKCVPMNVDRLELMELSDLGVELDPSFWRDATNRPLLDRLYKAVRTLESGYLQHCIVAKDKDMLSSRVHRKLLTSVNYFRRSFRAHSQDPENVVALAIALETLLTDFYSSGVRDRITDRVRLCLTSDIDVEVYRDAVKDLFESRGAIVHLGDAAMPQSFLKARQAYVLCFLEVVQRLDRLPTESVKPIADLLQASD